MVRLKGHFEHLQTAVLYVYGSDGFDRVDTVNIVNGDFDYRCNLEEPTVLSLMYPNFSETMFVAEPGTVCKYKADVSNLRHARITGTAANDTLTEFRKRYAERPLMEQQRAAEQYIRNNPGDIAALALFQRYFERAEEIHKNPTSALLELLRKNQSTRKAVKTLYQRMNPLMATSIGAKVRKDVMPPDSLPALVIFTISNQSKSYDLRRRAAEIMDKYGLYLKDVALDDKDIDSICIRYGMRYVPGCLLIDSKGIVRARDVEPDKLNEAAKKLK